MDKERIIRNFALQNAVKFNGKANAGNVIGKILTDFPEFRNDAKELGKEIQKAVEEVNKLTLDEQKKEIEKNAPELLIEKKKEKHEGLKPLKNAIAGKVVMRFEPSPSGPMHLGHAYPLMLNYEYCRIYNGTLILRISDTNPANIDPKAYKLLEEDFNWMCKGVKTKIIIQSDRMELYYKYAKKIIADGNAYVCTCKAEDFRESAKNKTACPCRSLNTKENMERWNKMFDGYNEGDAVVRLRTDITHKNPAMRDFPLLRIVETEHPRQKDKYRVWPLLNFAVTIDDYEGGLTHVLRGKDHYDNTQRQLWIFKFLAWKPPEYLHIGRINFEGLRLSATETRAAIEKGDYNGWDDIRLPFLQALKRRGYQPEAFRRFAISMGVTLVDKTVKAEEFFKNIQFLNKEIIDDKSLRYFFVDLPVKIEIEGAPPREIELDLHPEFKKGGRKFSTENSFYLSIEDFIKIKDKEFVRLMDCINFVKEKNKLKFVSTDYETYKDKGDTIIHWLPAKGKLIKTKIMMPDGTVKDGLSEEGIKELKIGAIIQFERFGFVRLDEISKDAFVFWFIHK